MSYKHLKLTYLIKVTKSNHDNEMMEAQAKLDQYRKSPNETNPEFDVQFLGYEEEE